MSKYYKADDIRHIIIQNNINNRKTLAADLIDIPTIEVSEDCIDRKKLLEQIDKDSEGSPGYYGDTWQFIKTIENAPSVIPKRSCYRCGLREDCADSSVAPQAKEGEWTPCSERLPRREEQDDELGVLVTLGNGYRGLQYDYCIDGTWFDWNGYVIAWMPLPKPFKGTE